MLFRIFKFCFEYKMFQMCLLSVSTSVVARVLIDKIYFKQRARASAASYRRCERFSSLSLGPDVITDNGARTIQKRKRQFVVHFTFLRPEDVRPETLKVAVRVGPSHGRGSVFGFFLFILKCTHLCHDQTSELEQGSKSVVLDRVTIVRRRYEKVRFPRTDGDRSKRCKNTRPNFAARCSLVSQCPVSNTLTFPFVSLPISATFGFLSKKSKNVFLKIYISQPSFVLLLSV